MNKFLHKKTIMGVTLAFGFWFTACQKEMSEKEEDVVTSTRNRTDVTPAAAITDLPGRTLAANCFQCHGTNGYAGELKIAGESTSEIISSFNEFKAENPRDNIMNLHAYAYTAEEIKLIAQYFENQ